jgi:predicted nucleotidyltransferase
VNSEQSLFTDLLSEHSMADLESYRQQRDLLITRIAETLSKDDRFSAAWLTGSISRDEADSLSDIDLTVVVSDTYSASLCTRLEQVSANTSPERYALFSQFGKPALIHENNSNAPESGTFTFVMYAESALMVDWVLMPQTKATRPHQSKLLFEKRGIPISPLPELEDLEQSKKSVAEMWAFFWMMTAVTIKYTHRDDSVFVTDWVERLHNLVYEIERRLNREPWQYQRGSRSRLQPTREKQIESIRELCNRVLELKTKVTEFSGTEPVTPLAEIETLLSFADNRQS